MILVYIEFYYKVLKTEALLPYLSVVLY